MKCPLLEASYNTNAGNLNGDEGECLKEDCAWWSVAGGCCSIVRLNNHLAQIDLKLSNIAKELTLISPK